MIDWQHIHIDWDASSGKQVIAKMVHIPSGTYITPKAVDDGSSHDLREDLRKQLDAKVSAPKAAKKPVARKKR